MPIYNSTDSIVREVSSAYIKKDGVLRTVSVIYIKTGNYLRIAWESVSRIWRHKQIWKDKITIKY